MKTTPNLGLKKPDQEDFYNVDDFNFNADKLDEEVARRMINAGGVPSAQAGAEADRPAPGQVGRLYIAKDTGRIFIDTGTAWALIATVNWSDIAGKPTSFAPSAHADTHKIGGSDPITPADIGAETPAGAQEKVDAHATRTDNPHNTTAAQVGALVSIDDVSNPGGNVDLVAGTNISITPDTTNKRITIAGTGDWPNADKVDGIDFRVNNGMLEYYDGGAWKSVSEFRNKVPKIAAFSILLGGHNEYVTAVTINGAGYITSITIGRQAAYSGETLNKIRVFIDGVQSTTDAVLTNGSSGNSGPNSASFIHRFNSSFRLDIAQTSTTSGLSVAGLVGYLLD